MGDIDLDGMLMGVRMESMAVRVVDGVVDGVGVVVNIDGNGLLMGVRVVRWLIGYGVLMGLYPSQTEPTTSL